MKIYMKINQLNGQSVENSRKNLHNFAMKVMGKEDNIVSTYTAYGRLVALNKKELTEALGKSTKKEKDKWIAKIDLMYKN